jgi:hypothetical protein
LNIKMERKIYMHSKDKQTWAWVVVIAYTTICLAVHSLRYNVHGVKLLLDLVSALLWR